MQVTWLLTVRRIDSPIERYTSIGWTPDHRIRSRARALIVSIITAEMKRWGVNRDRSIAIQGARSNAFYNASRGIASRRSILDPTATTFFETVHRGRFIVTVDRFDRTVTPKKPINYVFFTIISIRVEISIQLNCIDTLSLVSLDSFLFLSHFRIHGGVEVKIWWRTEGEIAA